MDREATIRQLEAALPEQPRLAAQLAECYKNRQVGDPAENWERRRQLLQMTLSQFPADQQPEEWAKWQNEIGVHVGQAPNADFAQAIENRIACHQAARTLLGEHPSQTLIDTLLNLSESYLWRTHGDANDNQRKAESYVREALQVASSKPEYLASRITATLSIVRLQLVAGRAVESSVFYESLQQLDSIHQQIGAHHVGLRATVELFRLNIYDQLIERGEMQWTGQLVAAAEAALQLLDPASQLDQRRTVLQIQGEALLKAAEYAQAAAALKASIDAADTLLSQATTKDGRLERIWHFRDSCTLLSHCYFRMEQFAQGLAALEQGKSRYWHATPKSLELAEVQQLAPPRGALLFANFAAAQGLVAVVTRTQCDIVWLSKFGKSQLLEVLRGAAEIHSFDEFGGWLKAYYTRHDQTQAWLQQIDAVGQVLYDEIWRPVLAKLANMGIERDAELVWIPQGGIHALPMHSAWRRVDGTRKFLLDDYAIRYAPSLNAIASRDAAPAPEPCTLIVANPRHDLDFAELELAWLLRAQQGGDVRTLRGNEATLDVVLAQLKDATAVHVATHAIFDIEDPLNSRLWLANNQQLTLEEWLPLLQAKAPATVSLSACETAVARVTITPDESLGFPAALLAAGTRTVLATMWPLHDAAAALLMHFYQVFLPREESAAQSLRRAQNTLRTITAREVMHLLSEFKNEPAPLGRIAGKTYRKLGQLDPDSRPFEHAHDWAAFAVFGS